MKSLRTANLETEKQMVTNGNVLDIANFKRFVSGGVITQQNSYLFQLAGPIAGYYVQKGYTGDELATAVWREVYAILMGFQNLTQQAA